MTVHPGEPLDLGELPELTDAGRTLLDKIAPAPKPDAQELHARAARGRRAGMAVAIAAVEQAVARQIRHGSAHTHNDQGEIVWLTDAARSGAGEDGLDAAWAEAEAALPEGRGLWLIQGVQLVDTSDSEDLSDEQLEWEAEAVDHQRGGQPRNITALGPTPAAALRALAERLGSPETPDEGLRAALEDIDEAEAGVLDAIREVLPNADQRVDVLTALHPLSEAIRKGAALARPIPETRETE